MMGEIQDAVGEFKRLRCTSKVLDNGEAILITPDV
jgi:hypothetical protein